MQHLSEEDACKQAFVMAIKDSLNVVSGKWKLAIVCTMLRGPRRFNEIERLLGGLTPRMLARELRELEVNGVITRAPMTAEAVDPSDTPATTKPRSKPAAPYRLTPSGQNLEAIIIGMAEWGVAHRTLNAQAPALAQAAQALAEPHGLAPAAATTTDSTTAGPAQA